MISAIIIHSIIRMSDACSFYSHLCLSVVGATLDWFGFLLFYRYMENYAWSVWVLILALLKTLFIVIYGLHRRHLLHQDVRSTSTFVVLSCLWLFLGATSTVTYNYWTFVFPTQSQGLSALLSVGTAITWAIPCSYFIWKYRQVALRPLRVPEITRPLLEAHCAGRG